MITIPEESSAAIQKFKLSRTTNIAYMILRIDKTSLNLTHSEAVCNTSIEDLVDNLETNKPCYILLIYVLAHPDGRKSYPFSLIFFTPSGCSPENSMLYSSSLHQVLDCGSIGKTIELRDLDDLDDDFIKENL